MEELQKVLNFFKIVVCKMGLSLHKIH